MHSKTSRLLLAILSVTAGVLHFVFPTYYMKIIPPWLLAPGAGPKSPAPVANSA